jgi:hypothetical protein
MDDLSVRLRQLLCAVQAGRAAAAVLAHDAAPTLSLGTVRVPLAVSNSTFAVSSGAAAPEEQAGALQPKQLDLHLDLEPEPEQQLPQQLPRSRSYRQLRSAPSRSSLKSEATTPSRSSCKECASFLTLGLSTAQCSQCRATDPLLPLAPGEQQMRMQQMRETALVQSCSGQQILLPRRIADCPNPFLVNFSGVPSIVACPPEMLREMRAQAARLRQQAEATERDAAHRGEVRRHAAVFGSSAAAKRARRRGS